VTGEQLLEREHVSSELPMLCETAARLEHDQEAHDDSGQECAAQAFTITPWTG
jgi:hypothetical protein